MNHRIDDVYIFLVTNDVGDEGVAAFFNPTRKRLEPLVASTEEKLAEMTELAQGMVSLNGQPMTIAHFTQREDVSEIVPAPGGGRDGMTVQNAFWLGFGLGLCVSPVLVLLCVVALKRNREREDPWL